jgi:hypothetical protein
MDQKFHTGKNKSSKFILLMHAYPIRLKSSKYAKMSAYVYSNTVMVGILGMRSNWTHAS